MPYTVQWLQTQIDRYLTHEQPHYEAYSVFLKRVLTRACEKLAPTAVVQARPKAPASFAEKCIRKFEKYKDPVSELTDLCGARVIVDTREEVNRCCDFIRRHFVIDEANSEDVRERLKSSEFGYLSVHFVVQVPDDFAEFFPLRENEPQQLQLINSAGVLGAVRRKAEIQVRTRLQHIWADTFHDRIYKSRFKLPKQYLREASRLAALVESADDGFGDLRDKIDAFEVDYGAYLSAQAMKEEIEILSTIVDTSELSSNRPELTLRIAKIARALGEWDTVIARAEPLIQEPSRVREKLQIEFGFALCKKHESDPRAAGFVRGQEHLSSVARPHASGSDIGLVEPDEIRARALAWLAWSKQKARVGFSHGNARDLYYQAYLYSPSDPYHFTRFLEAEIKLKQSLDFVPVVRPQIEAAVKLCCEHARVGIEIPYAYFALAKLHLFSGRTHEAMLAYAQAICTSSTDYAIVEELNATLELKDYIGNKLPDLEHVRQLLVVGSMGKLLSECEHLHLAHDEAVRKLARRREAGEITEPDIRRAEDRIARAREQAEQSARRAEEYRQSAFAPPGTPSHPNQVSVLVADDLRRQSPIAIIVGGTHPKHETEMQAYRQLLERAFQGFAGTVFSGGTKAGIPGLLGAISEQQRAQGPAGFRLCGYVPHRLPIDAPRDERYMTFRTGEDFSFRQPLQNWIDLLAAGQKPREVRVLGINGGKISEFEFYLALALGAIVGLVEESGRSAGKLLEEEPWWTPGQLAAIPEDAMTVRAFLHTTAGDWKRPELEGAARKVHADYVESSRSRGASEADWKDLDEDFKRSCFHQVLYAENILKTAGFAIRPVSGPDRKPFDFNDPEVLGPERVRQLAEMEHGRWNAERLMQGWRYGEKKNVEKKISPYLIPWDKLPEKIRGYDIEAIVKLPRVLLASGLEVYKQ